MAQFLPAEQSRDAGDNIPFAPVHPHHPCPDTLTSRVFVFEPEGCSRLIYDFRTH